MIQRIPVMLAALVAVLVVSLPVQAADTVAQIHATGQAQASIAPDMATVQLSVTREAKTAQEALKENSVAMAEVIAAMKAAGVAERDLQTSNFSIDPRYRRGEQPRTIDSYQVRNTLTVIVRDLDKLGSLLDRSVNLGVNEGGHISFGNADPSAALDAARADAVKDAMHRAKTMADAAGVKLGDVVAISEQAGVSHPRPMMMARGAAMAAESVPVATGENSYQVTIQLSVAIEQ